MKSRSAADSTKGWARIQILALFILATGIAGIVLAWADGNDGKGNSTTNSPNQGDINSNAKYEIGLWGDLPYSDVQANPGVPNLIADMNDQDVAFSVHDGDLKAGSGTPNSLSPTTCADAKYVQAMEYLNMLHAPAAFTPGDNDWTDCDAASNGPFNSLERLDHERALFFSTPYTFGQNRLYQEVQGMTTNGAQTPCLGFKTGSGALDVNGNGLDPGTYNNVACVENRRWQYHGVTYATLNIQGSCDNRCKDHPDPHEADVRQAAAIAWMQDTFRVATERKSVAVMFISQADPGFHNHPIESEPIRNPKTLDLVTPIPAGVVEGHKAFLVALRTAVKDFEKPVVYVHGDTHYFRVDKPFYDSDPPDSVNTGLRRLENFTRIETFGDNVISKDAAHPDISDLNNVHWVKVLVDPSSREVFSIQPQIVPKNRVVVPAP
jgi:hypothetical protein